MGGQSALDFSLPPLLPNTAVTVTVKMDPCLHVPFILAFVKPSVFQTLWCIALCYSVVYTHMYTTSWVI